MRRPQDAPIPGLLIAAAVCAVLSLDRAGGQSQAQGFTVAPVTVEMEPGQTATVLTLENHTDREATFQIRPFAWDQPDGSDRLQDTDGLLASPPIGLVAPGATQVVRLVLRRPAAPGRESAYRIWLDQVPPPPGPGAVSFALRLSIPVFAEPPGRLQAQVRWRVEPDQEGYRLVGANEGGRRQAVHDLVLTAPDGRRLELEQGVSPYILAGATRRWRIRAGAPGPGEALRLTAQADTGPIQEAVPVRRDGP